MKTFLQALLLSLSAGLCGAAPAQAPEPAVALTPPEHRRGPEQTFLTYPEWFLVFSPAELADTMRTQPPDDFPYFGHIRQFWSGYAQVRQVLRRGGYPFNFGYHVMIVVIGVSTTAEYALRSLYETLVGRLTALTLHGDSTAEDRYAATVQQDYVDFIRVLPWYQYDFRGKLAHLWTDTPAWGPHLLRKWERRYALTSEYVVKAIYGWIIGKATHATYDKPILATAVVLDHAPAPAGLPELRVLRTNPDGSVVALVPRYQAFMQYADALAAQGLQFHEVAGNRGPILVSVLVPDDWRPLGAQQQVLFSQPVLTAAGSKRVVLTVPVPQLAGLLQQLHAPGVRLEHVFDY
jgi:hypothetical protein